MSARALEGPRVMDQMFSRLDVQGLPGAPYYTLTSGDNWEVLVAGAGETVYVSRKYYDLSGYNRDFLTTFVQGVDVQEGHVPTGDMAAFIVLDLITSEYPTDAEVLVSATNPPGFPESTSDMSTIIYGRHRQYRTDANIGGFPIVVGASMWGTMPATTADKVHLTRIVITSTPAAAPETLAVPPANYVTAAIVSKEAELPFLMRQKRSYELATGP
jgi:hypothetical protein